MLRQRRQPRPALEEKELFPASATSSSDGMMSWWSPHIPNNALTENEDEIWNAGQFAPASIRFEFDTHIRCTRIDLLPCMEPKSGHVVHEIRAGSDVFRFSGRATDRRWIQAELSPEGQRAKTIEIHTLESPSWVAWRQVRFWTTHRPS